MRKIFSLLNGLLLISCLSHNTSSMADQSQPDVSQLIIIALDGTDSRWVNAGQTPFLKSLMGKGSATLKMRNVVPTITAPNFTSSLTGTLPELHGVYTNDWSPGTSIIPPSIFDLYSATPEKVLIVSDDWDYYKEAFATPPKKEYPHVVLKRIGDTDQNYLDNALATLNLAKQKLLESSPELVFIYLQHVDHIGHTTGWGSADYRSALSQTDTWMKNFFKELDPTGLRHKMFITDHGGKLFHHANGDNDPNIRNIPFSLTGPGIKSGHQITESKTIQIAPTVAQLLNKNSFNEWAAEPLNEVFISENKTDSAKN